jgi:hypothetical protein
METHSSTMSANRCSMSFPPAITVEGATLRRGGEMVRIYRRTTSPCPVAHQRQKAWGRSLNFLPLQVRPNGRGGDTPATARPGLSRPTRGIRANPLPIRLSRQGPDHSSEGSAL